MTQFALEKNELDEKLNYFIDNKEQIGIVVYAITRGSLIPKKMDIEADAQAGLKDLFLDHIKETIVENNELSVVPLSSSDERINVLYQYDIEIPPELSVINSVITQDDLPLFNIADDGIDNIKVLLIVLGDNQEQLVLYKTMAPVNIFSRSSFFLKKSRTRFEKIDEDFFRISSGFQLM